MKPLLYTIKLQVNFTLTHDKELCSDQVFSDYFCFYSISTQYQYHQYHFTIKVLFNGPKGGLFRGFMVVYMFAPSKQTHGACTCRVCESEDWSDLLSYKLLIKLIVQLLKR